MRTLRSVFKSLIIILLIGSVNDISAQNIYLANTQKSDLKINGTSTLHDWVMDTENFDCVFEAQIDNTKIKIKKVKFSCNTTSIKSENSIMDKKAWEALKSKDFKTILFETDEMNEFIVSDRKVEGKLIGNLLLAGEKRKITLQMMGKMDELGNMEFTGQVNIKMSEYGIIPPTAVMGTIKTGDKITIIYDFSFNQSNVFSKN